MLFFALGLLSLRAILVRLGSLLEAMLVSGSYFIFIFANFWVLEDFNRQGKALSEHHLRLEMDRLASEARMQIQAEERAKEKE